MSDLSITAASVIAGADGNIEHGRAGATLTAGQVIYRAATDAKYKLADNDSGTAEVRRPRGIALHGASDNQPLAILRKGDITIGATLVAGTTYCLSSTPGAICPQADLASGDDVVIIGVAKSTSVLAVDIQISGVTL